LESQLGSVDVIESADKPEEILYEIGHLLPRDRFALEFLAADANPADMAIFVFEPAARLKEVTSIETPAEQVREAFRSDPARFSGQVLAPLVAVAATIATGLALALFQGSR